MFSILYCLCTATGMFWAFRATTRARQYASPAWTSLWCRGSSIASSSAWASGETCRVSILLAEAGSVARSQNSRVPELQPKPRFLACLGDGCAHGTFAP